MYGEIMSRSSAMPLARFTPVAYPTPVVYPILGGRLVVISMCTVTLLLLTFLWYLAGGVRTKEGGVRAKEGVSEKKSAVSEKKNEK